MIKKFKEFLETITSAFFFTWMAIALTFLIFWKLAMDLSKTPCDFLACQYKSTLEPILVLAFVILFLPLAIPTILNVPLPANTQAILFIISVPYWFLLSFIISYVYTKIKKVPFRAMAPIGEKERFLFARDVGVFFIFYFLFYGFLITFLYYPKLSIELTFSDFMLAFSVVVVILTLFYNIKNPKVETYILTT